MQTGTGSHADFYTFFSTDVIFLYDDRLLTA
jgi:hypothetical protein